MRLSTYLERRRFGRQTELLRDRVLISQPEVARSSGGLNQHGVLGLHPHVVVVKIERGEEDGRGGDVGEGVGRVLCSVDMMHAEVQPNDEVLLVERLAVKELVEVDGRLAGKMDVPVEGMFVSLGH